MASRDDGVRVDTVVCHLAPFCRHGTKKAESSERAKKCDEDERLPLSQHQAEHLLHGGRYPDDVEAAELAEIEDKGAGDATRRRDAAAMRW